MLSLSRRETYHGPNPFSPEAVVTADLTLSGDIVARSPDITAELGELSKAWFSWQRTSEAESGDSRLVDFILQWALAALMAIKGYLQVCGYRRTSANSFRAWLAFHRPAISYSALTLAVRLVNLLAEGRDVREQLGPQLERFWAPCWQVHPDSSDEIIMEAARVCDIPWLAAWGLPYHWQFGWGARSQVISSGASNQDGAISARVISQKHLSKSVIARLGLPTPRHALVRRDEDIAAAVEKVGFPCVVKPTDQGGGRGVSAQLRTLDDVRAAVAYARGFSRRPILIEAFVEGRDHRLMVVAGRFIGAFRREAPTVVGDGARTVRELTEEKNRGRALPGVAAAYKLSTIQLDDAAAVQHLAGQGVSLETVLASGQEVRIRSNDNVSTGGSCIDVSEEIHPDVRAGAEALARTMDVYMAGFDYMTTDFSRSWREVPGNFIELNTTPGLGAMTLAGWPAAEVGKLALGDRPGRIPLDILVLPDGLLADAEVRISEQAHDSKWGWASHDKAVAGGLALQPAGDHPWAGVVTLLSHRTVEKALVLVSSSHLQRHGLAVDRADRIWDCTDDLPEEWRQVLDRAARAPVWRGPWKELAGPEDFLRILGPELRGCENPVCL